jgi:hypothetical protein
VQIAVVSYPALWITTDMPHTNKYQILKIQTRWRIPKAASATRPSAPALPSPSTDRSKRNAACRATECGPDYAAASFSGEDNAERKKRKAAQMARNKFKLGQIVFLQPTIFNRDAARGAYEVTKQLPERDGQFEYHVKSSREPHERVVRESELSLE